jgi:hypothetical protein
LSATVADQPESQEGPKAPIVKQLAIMDGCLIRNASP